MRILCKKTKKYFKQKVPTNFAIVGGASANLRLRNAIEDLCKKHNTKLFLSQLKYCSDNAAMIGRVAVEQYNQKDFVNINEIAIQTRLKDF